MDGKHADSKLRRLGNCSSHGVRNVVIFQVEKHAPSRGYKIPHHLRAFGRVELHADLVSEGRIADRRHDLLGGGGAGNVKRNDELVARIAWLKLTTSMAHAVARDAVGLCSRHPDNFTSFTEVALQGGGYRRPPGNWVRPGADPPDPGGRVVGHGAGIGAPVRLRRTGR